MLYLSIPQVLVASLQFGKCSMFCLSSLLFGVDCLVFSNVAMGFGRSSVSLVSLNFGGSMNVVRNLDEIRFRDRCCIFCLFESKFTLKELLWNLEIQENIQNWKGHGRIVILFLSLSCSFYNFLCSNPPDGHTCSIHCQYAVNIRVTLV
jgi:hypothetical protein